jgi:tellurite methyltransferase
MTPALPPGLVAYRRTPIFTETTLPTGLRHRHQTKAGVWGLIVVLEGRLRFRRLDPFCDTTLGPAATAVIAPEEAHEVKPTGAVRFYIEFYRAAASSPP